MSDLTKDTLGKLVEKKLANNPNKRISDKIKDSNKPAILNMPVSHDGVSKKTSFYNVSYSQFRQFADSYPIVRACINHRIAQVTQLDWMVSPTEVIVDDKKEKETYEITKKVKNLLKYPTGDKSTTFRGFITQIVEDALVIDAVAIERIRNFKNEVVGWKPFDGATIELIAYPDGRIPEPPEAAYQQKVNGQVYSKLTTDDMYYGKIHPRTHTLYGMSPIEVLVATITTALKLQSYNLAYLQDGNVPEGFVEIPKDIASSPEQLREWQSAWDAIFSGDPRYQRKLKFLPEGMKYHETKKPSDMTFERFEKWLLLNTCAAFKVSPQDIGFTFDANKAIAETQWEIGKERGMMPLVHFIKEMMDQMIQDDLGHEDLEFVFTNLNPTNRLEEAKVFQILVNAGAISIDEWRIGEGKKPIGVPHFISTPIGPIFTHDLIEQSEAGFEPAMPYTKPVETGATTGTKPEGTGTKTGNQVTNPDTARRQARQESMGDTGGASKNDVISDIKKWKKVAKNDLKSGKPFRKFRSNILNQRTQWMIENGLKTVEKKEDIDSLFGSFIESADNKEDSMKELYERIDSIIQG